MVSNNWVNSGIKTVWQLVKLKCGDIILWKQKQSNTLHHLQSHHLN